MKLLIIRTPLIKSHYWRDLKMNMHHIVGILYLILIIDYILMFILHIKM